MAFRNYLEGEDDKPYFHLNSLAYYYEKMEGFAAAVENAAKTLNLTKEEIDQRVTAYILENKTQLDLRLGEWDEKLLQFDGSVMDLLAEWVDDGTLNHIIDTTLIDEKIAPLAGQLAKTVKLDDTGVLGLNVFDENARNVLQGQEPGTINAVLGYKNVEIENLAFINESSNKFDRDKALLNFVVSTAGVLTPNTEYALSDYITVKANTEYSTRTVAVSVFYTKDKIFIGRPAITNDKFTTPENVGLVRLMYFKTGIATVQMNEGGTLLPYESYYRTLPKTLFPLKGVDSTQRTDLGNILTVNMGIPYKLPNIDMVEKKVEVFGQFSLMWANKRHDVGLLPGDVYTIDFSAQWQNTSVHIYFNTDTKTFNVYRSTEIQGIKESDMFFMAIYKNADKGTLLGVTCVFEYTLNGSDNKNYYVMNNVPEGWYDSAPREAYSVLGITLQDIYSVYDRHTTDYPDYVTKTDFGLDATGQYPIYSYHYRHPEVQTTEYSKRIPKIIIFTNTHGDEKAATIALRNFMDDVCTKWQENKLLEYIKFNTEIIIIPIVNPHGFIEHKRKNGNGVDINRQFPYRWGTPSGSPENATYKGPSPLSEIEAQNINNILTNNPDAMVVYDFHMNGTSGLTYDGMYWNFIPIDVKNQKGFEKLNKISKYNISKITREAQKRYTFPLDSGFIGHVTYDTANPDISVYANYLGIPSMTIECTRRLLNGSVGTYTAEINQLNTEFIGNTILETVREFGRS